MCLLYPQVFALKQLLQQLSLNQHLYSPTHIEVAGLVAAVDGSRCLLAMPDSWWLLLQQLHTYDLQQGYTGAWGVTTAAASPMLVHACFTLNRTGLGRMQSVLPYVAVSPRLLLPPDLLSEADRSQQPAAVAAAGNVSTDLAASGSIASAEKQHEVRAGFSAVLDTRMQTMSHTAAASVFVCTACITSPGQVLLSNHVNLMFRYPGLPSIP